MFRRRDLGLKAGLSATALKAVAAPAALLNAAAAPLKPAAAPAAPLKAAAAPSKATASDVRCHSCTAPDVDAPATGGLLVPRTNMLLPPRFFAPTNQFAGRWQGNACGGFPPRRALLRSLSHSCAASQSNASDITGGEIKVPRRWRRRREARAVKPAVASHRPETEQQEPLALLDGWRSGPCWGALHLTHTPLRFLFVSPAGQLARSSCRRKVRHGHIINQLVCRPPVDCQLQRSILRN
jgi:hypothetical protein